MAGQRLTDKSAAEKLAADDLLMCVDVSDTTGSAEGTSLKIQNKFVIQTDIVSMVASDFHALNSSAFTLVAAPGSGYAVLPLGCIIYVDYGTTGTSDRIAIFVGHEATGAYYWGQIGSFMRNISTDATYVFAIGGFTADSSIDNMALKMHSDASFHGTVDWTAKVYVTYQILKL
jgi:hypothetical protein